MSARDEIEFRLGVSDCTTEMKCEGCREAMALADRYRAEAVAERDAEIMRWLGKKAREYRATGKKADAERADFLNVIASKISRGAVRPNNTMLPAGVKPTFFEPGRTYQRDGAPFEDETWTFKVAAVATDPHGRLAAFGFLSRDGASWLDICEGTDSWAKDGWTEVTDGGER
jgi:hypothetical protein